MQLLESARGALEAAGYLTSSSTGQDRQFTFEDANVFGFVRAFAAVGELIETWERTQDSFTRQSITELTRVPAKALNVYAVFLTPDQPTRAQRTSLVQIEEDFRSARKIARAGTVTREDLEAALTPLLPLRRVSPLVLEDVVSRLKADSAITPKVLGLLLERAEPARVCHELLEDS